LKTQFTFFLFNLIYFFIEWSKWLVVDYSKTITANEESISTQWSDIIYECFEHNWTSGGALWAKFMAIEHLFTLHIPYNIMFLVSSTSANHQKWLYICYEGREWKFQAFIWNIWIVLIKTVFWHRLMIFMINVWILCLYMS
jgi:hypothetical protein